MELTNISKGMIFKNYSALCRELGIVPKQGGRSKQLQMQEIGRYMRLKKAAHGHEITVVEVYDEPLEKSETRICFSKDISLLLIDYFSYVDGTVYQFVKSDFLRLEGLMNEEYLRYRNKPQNLYGLSNDLTTLHVKNFFERADRKFTLIIESGLKELARQELIVWEYNYLICEKDSHGLLVYRTISKDHYELLLGPLLLQNGFKSMKDAFIHRKLYEVAEELNRKNNWLSCYRVWRVYGLNTFPEINQDIEVVRKRVTENMIKFLDNEAEKIYGKNKADRTQTFKYRKGYISSQRIMSELTLTLDKQYTSRFLCEVAGAENAVKEKKELEDQMDEIIG